MNAAYGDTHRRFLKNLMSSYVVAQEKAVDLYCSCRDPDSNAATQTQGTQELGKDPEKAIVRFIEQINAKIEPLNLSIRLVTCEATNKKFYVLHTILENEITKAAAGRQRGRNERALLKLIIKAILKSPAGKTSTSTCVREGGVLPEKIKRADALKILEKLVLEKWLVEIHDQIFVGPRTIAELGRYLKDEFEEVGNCKLCKDTTIRGPCCPNCGVRVHTGCLQSYFVKVKSRKCMNCQELWPEEEKGESDDPDSDDNDEPMEVDT